MINASQEVWILANREGRFICKSGPSVFISNNNVKRMVTYTYAANALNAKKDTRYWEHRHIDISLFVPKKVTIIVQDEYEKPINIKESL